MSDEATPTFTMTLAGREIEFRRANLGQVLVLQRLYRRELKRSSGSEDDKGEAITAAVIRTLDFIDTLFITEEDRQFVEDQMLSGAIDWQEILPAMSGGVKDAPADDEAPAPVRRAPKKSPKAAAAKSPSVAVGAKAVAKKTTSARAAKR